VSVIGEELGNQKQIKEALLEKIQSQQQANLLLLQQIEDSLDKKI